MAICELIGSGNLTVSVKWGRFSLDKEVLVRIRDVV